MADLIDREEAIKVISNDSLNVKYFCVIGRGQENRELAKTTNDYIDLLLETAKRKILSLPTADTERHAHWIRINDVFSQCSNCKTNILSCDTNNYCPHCGCKMDEVQE